MVDGVDFFITKVFVHLNLSSSDFPDNNQMAESFLFSIAESLISKAASSAFEQVSQLLGVYDEVREFKQTVSYVKAVLLDAERQQDPRDELKEWLRQIKRIFYDAENLLDLVECEMLRKKVVKAHGTLKTKVGHFLSSSNPIVLRYTMSQKIKDIKRRLDLVAADRDKFGLKENDVDRQVVHRREMTHSHVVESTVIGREHDKEKIIELLMQQNLDDDGDGDKSVCVLPIVGIGGLGKTTLAKFVYNDKRVDDAFSLKMWVCASDDFDIKQLIIKMINSADESDSIPQQNLSGLDIDQLQNRLRRKLASRKFLLVLDDVWNEDRAKWTELRDLTQVGARGSTVMVTTRDHKIASMMGTIHSYCLEGLSLEDSLSLFVKWAFKEGEEEKYPNLRDIGREIVKKSGGIPLAARTLGSSLFSILDTNEWESVRDNGIWNLPQKKDDILPALKLSYDQMPSYLRQCFALFSLFPKNHRFNSFQVTSLWLAAGFLSSQSKNKNAVDLANQCLHELVSRSFIQDFDDLGSFYAFSMHDLVHDLALYVAKDECMIQQSHIQNIPESVLHLSFTDSDLFDKSNISETLGVRTILFPIVGVGANNKGILNTWLSRYKYLRYLDLSDSTFETLPRSIGKLKYLRYFSLADNKRIRRLPNSICMLQNLQVLFLDGCIKLEILPKGMRMLISLQMLTITTKQSVLPESYIANLSSLHYLCVDSCEKLESLFVGIKLPNLRTLYVKSCENLKSLPLDANHFPQLETLIVARCDNLDLSREHEHGIQNSNLRLKLLILEEMPQLVTLPHWVQACANTLQFLLIGSFGNLEVLPDWLSSLSFLKFLWISNCPKLVSLPSDIHRLTALEFLQIEDCPELCKKCQPQVGEYWTKISHIKRITIDEKQEDNEVESYDHSDKE